MQLVLIDILERLLADLVDAFDEARQAIVVEFAYFLGEGDLVFKADSICFLRRIVLFLRLLFLRLYYCLLFLRRFGARSCCDFWFAFRGSGLF